MVFAREIESHRQNAIPIAATQRIACHIQNPPYRIGILWKARASDCVLIPHLAVIMGIVIAVLRSASQSLAGARQSRSAAVVTGASKKMRYALELRFRLLRNLGPS